MIVYGPVPSRRLGQSVGINNIPPKACTYSCVYCQIGRTDHMRLRRRAFFAPEEIYRQVAQKIEELKENGVHADYLSFVPDGEPTLDIHLGKHIELLKPFGIKIAVITNASLLWMDDVKADLNRADWVSVKLDAANSDVWKKIDRPHGALELQTVLQGITDFAKQFQGTLVTETMLIRGRNDDIQRIAHIAQRIADIRPKKAYLLVPNRPPAETGVTRPAWPSILDAYEELRKSGIDVECITGDEDDTFYFTEDIAGDLLRISAVHPVREDVIENVLKVRKAGREAIDELISSGRMGIYTFEGKRFYKKII